MKLILALAFAIPGLAGGVDELIKEGLRAQLAINLPNQGPCSETPSADPPVTCSPEGRADHRRRAMVKLLEPILADMQRSDGEHDGSPTPLFRTNYDWHSSVHAHWSALAMGRQLGDMRLVKQVLKRMDMKQLRKERENLRQSPDFELPYGQAWMLLTLNELERHNEHPKSFVQGFRKEILDRLFKWLEATPFPDGKNGTCNSHHDSWLMTLLLVKKSKPPASHAKFLERMQNKLMAAPACRQMRNIDDFDFLSTPTLLIMNGKTSRIRAPDLLRTSEDLYRRATAKLTVENSHLLGAAASLSWQTASLSGQGNLTACREFTKYLDSTLSRPELWKSDFVYSSHWVPQFLWFGIWLEMGEP